LRRADQAVFFRRDIPERVDQDASIVHEPSSMNIQPGAAR
jgi:hypothetical protein